MGKQLRHRDIYIYRERERERERERKRVREWERKRDCWKENKIERERGRGL